jgi:hypothetical protein
MSDAQNPDDYDAIADEEIFGASRSDAVVLSNTFQYVRKGDDTLFILIVSCKQNDNFNTAFFQSTGTSNTGMSDFAGTWCAFAGVVESEITIPVRQDPASPPSNPMQRKNSHMIKMSDLYFPLTCSPPWMAKFKSIQTRVPVVNIILRNFKQLNLTSEQQQLFAAVHNICQYFYFYFQMQISAALQTRAPDVGDQYRPSRGIVSTDRANNNSFWASYPDLQRYVLTHDYDENTGEFVEREAPFKLFLESSGHLFDENDILELMPAGEKRRPDQSSDMNEFLQKNNALIFSDHRDDRYNRSDTPDDQNVLFNRYYPNYCPRGPTQGAQGPPAIGGKKYKKHTKRYNANRRSRKTKCNRKTRRYRKTKRIKI